MKHTMRLWLTLSMTALFSTACTTAPYEDPTAEASSTSNGSTYSNNSIPEAGPLTGGGSGANYAYTPPQQPVYQPPAPTYQAPPVQAPAQPPANQYAYAQPDAGGGAYDSYAGGESGYDTSANSYDYGAAANPASGGSTPGAYDYAAANGGNGNGGYDYTANTGATQPSYSGGGDNYASGDTGSSNYYAGGNSSSNNYAANTSNTGSLGSSSGSAAVQVFASGSSTKAQEIRSAMASRGLNAIVDQADGLYKVRIPFSNESEARANLTRVRSASGESGAFVTFR